MIPWAVVPVKALALAKQRLVGTLDEALRQELALAMLEDVLDCLVAVKQLAGIIVATADARAAALAVHYGAALSRTDASLGHSEAVAAASRRLAREGAAMLTLPADIPLARPADVARVIAACDAAPGFAIVPARDGRGSNAVLCAPADAVPLRFGGASFLPHVAAARARGLVPAVLAVPRIALDIDDGADLAAFLAVPSRSRARAVIERSGIDLSQRAEARA
jgi:2-phospho-L-lactate/phosphoenolpyruvate guanylyltransferase